MEALFSLIFYGVVILSIVRAIRKRKNALPPEYKTVVTPKTNNKVASSNGFQRESSSMSNGFPRESGAMKHTHRKPGKYDTFNKKTKFHSKETGSMPHEHRNEKYVSMADASNLPKGYILLNGEPVRVADLEGK